jgi:hypothetical protein
MPGVDRNAANAMRLRRNMQRGRNGAFTSGIKVAAPLQNTGSQVQLNLDPSGGIEVSTQLLRVKLRDTAFLRDASGLGIKLGTNPGLQVLAAGLVVQLDGTSLSLGANGIKLTGYMPYAIGTITVPTGNFVIHSRRLTLTSASRLTLQGTASIRIT